MFAVGWLCVQAALLRICQRWVSQADLGVACSAECFIHSLLFFFLGTHFFPPGLQPPTLPAGELQLHGIMGPILASLCGMLESGVGTMG